MKASIIALAMAPPLITRIFITNSYIYSGVEYREMWFEEVENSCCRDSYTNPVLVLSPALGETSYEDLIYKSKTLNFMVCYISKLNVYAS